MLSDEQYVALSNFRYRLSQFLRFSERISRQYGVSTSQYQLMLHIQAVGDGGTATVGDLAKRLDTTHQAAVALIKRSAARGLVAKRRSKEDERKVEVRLTAAGRRLIEQLAERHIEALGGINDVIRITRLTDGTSKLLFDARTSPRDRRRPSPRRTTRAGAPRLRPAV